MTQSIALKNIRIDGGTQPRVLIDEEAVMRYAEKITGGTLLPPVDIFFDGVNHWLADGFHRYHAGMKLGHLAITAIVHTGTKRDAVLFSVGANDGHGIQRTNADKRKAVTTLLQDEEWNKWADREIARRCGVHHVFVGDVRRSLVIVTSDKDTVTYTTKHGTESTMNVEKIGRRPHVSRSEKDMDARKGAAAEGVSAGMLRRWNKRDDAEIVANAMQTFDGIVETLGRVDASALAGDSRAPRWRETAASVISVLRAFNRNIERKTA